MNDPIAMMLSQPATVEGRAYAQGQVLGTAKGQRLTSTVEGLTRGHLEALRNRGLLVPAESGSETPAPAPSTALPDSFPGRAPLLAAGLDCMERVAAAAQREPLTAIRGIGKSTASQIQAALTDAGL